MGGHGLPIEESLQIGGEVSRRGIAVARIDSQGLEHDAIELAHHRPAQLRGTLIRLQILANTGARRRRALPGSQLGHLLLDPAKGRASRQQEIENGTQRIDIRGGLQWRAVHLFRARVTGRHQLPLHTRDVRIRKGSGTE